MKKAKYCPLLYFTFAFVSVFVFVVVCLFFFCFCFFSRKNQFGVLVMMHSMSCLLSVHECFFLSSVALKESKCTLIQERLLNTLLGDPPTYVASFGNSAVNNVGDWVKILNVEKPANEVTQNNPE